MALPSELIDRIAHLLPPADRRSLAAVCTTLHAARCRWFRGAVVQASAGDNWLDELAVWLEERQACAGCRHLLWEATQGLDPADVWRFFVELSSIPRPSHHEQQVAAYLLAWAQERGLASRQDGAGNVLIYRNGTGGGEEAPPVVLQAHTDMVPATAPGVQHNWSADPIPLVRDGDWIRANGTTLGADDGIGVAAILAVLDQPADALLPPIQALFTTNEDDGFTGAQGLDPDMLAGAQWLINLDSGEFRKVYIGSAGGGSSELELVLPLEAGPAGGVLLEVQVSGLLGGHSGLDISKPRANAAKLLAALAHTLLEAEPKARLVNMTAVTAANAIPPAGAAHLVVPAGHAEQANATLQARWAELQQQYGSLETSMALSISQRKTDKGQRVLEPDAAARLVGLVRALPNGVLKCDSTLPGQAETSTSLDILKTTAAGTATATFELDLLTRSSLDSVADWRAIIAEIGQHYGARVSQGETYPGWPAQPDSLLANITAEAYAAVTGQQPELVAVHAGLEVGYILAKLPHTVEAIAIGPTILDEHTVNERVSISSVQSFHAALLGTLGRLAELQ
ncbi:aminoacyl-histidine dipeptidase [Chlorella sorokiniana]|uniref:Aminoacyl-histidine dipeptidase n=1 Tax=Chlorella sorokiniana TaxID=3076 RepID=A0A2P6TRI8_CHLSO|nr:aminoacyl-histidine dipeptidase [Chlorella sorokiniana]|eukprot:PRW56679.1 aminoacyl-histidine dipeptidase [Chlorella sorokiniana]